MQTLTCMAPRAWLTTHTVRRVWRPTAPRFPEHSYCYRLLLLPPEALARMAPRACLTTCGEARIRKASATALTDRPIRLSSKHTIRGRGLLNHLAHCRSLLLLHDFRRCSRNLRALKSLYIRTMFRQIDMMHREPSIHIHGVQSKGVVLPSECSTFEHAVEKLPSWCA